MKKVFAIVISLSLLSACSIKQTVEPAELTHDANVCVVNNPKVKEGFLVAIRHALDTKAIAYTVIEPAADSASCEWKITYTANWGWDMAAYLSYAKISVHRGAELDGEAEYDARQGSGRLDKFIDADEKVHELMDALIKYHQAFLNVTSFASLQ